MRQDERERRRIVEDVVIAIVEKSLLRFWDSHLEGNL